MPQSNTTIAKDADTHILYQHSACPHWGVGLLAWEQDGKRGYQFEDGKLRVFKEGYYDLLKPVDRPMDESASLQADLNRQLASRPVSKRKAKTFERLPLAKQMEYFAKHYPKGFQGAKWAKKHRGLDAAKTLKRHRNAAVADAKKLLVESRLMAMLQSGQALRFFDELSEVFAGTDMVSNAESKGLDRVSEKHAELLLRSLMNLLWGEGDYGLRFNTWLSALRRATGADAGWSLATAIPALVFPKEHLCVKLSTFTRQAAWMAPNLVLAKKPSARAYERLVKMTQSMGEKLEARGLRPSDMIDMYDFIGVTLRPKAIKEMTSAKAGDDAGLELEALDEVAVA